MRDHVDGTNRLKLHTHTHFAHTVTTQQFYTPKTRLQGCSLGLERLGLEVVSRRFLDRLGLVSVLVLVS